MKLRDACLIPVLERIILAHFGAEYPWPEQARIEAFLCAFGYSQGAIRTALSRARAQGELIALDSDGKRLGAGELMSRYTSLFLSEPFSPGDFSLLLFHFASEQSKQRTRLKDMLAQFNYRMITQNAYLRYGARGEDIQAFLEAQGFAGHIYSFQLLPELPARLVHELPEMYQLLNWAERLKQAKIDFGEYLAQPGTLQERYWRYLFARASFHANLLTAAPYLPDTYFPEVRLTQEIFTGLTSQAPGFATAYQACFV
ncbi:MAG: hypothetical protein CVV27_01450 [Candidatus Melainabacteria bacterium HGW-Melainabacteria-1]|nr:MAG: hypothetical protein CVV27_01450 [Candidatus Melainabacteria bacterium HGW-Melainabacteria-1]